MGNYLASPITTKAVENGNNYDYEPQVGSDEFFSDALLSDRGEEKEQSRLKGARIGEFRSENVVGSGSEQAVSDESVPRNGNVEGFEGGEVVKKGEIGMSGNSEEIVGFAKTEQIQATKNENLPEHVTDKSSSEISESPRGFQTTPKIALPSKNTQNSTPLLIRPCGPIEYGVCSMQGWRNGMEDTHVADTQFLSAQVLSRAIYGAQKTPPSPKKLRKTLSKKVPSTEDMLFKKKGIFVKIRKIKKNREIKKMRKKSSRVVRKNGMSKSTKMAIHNIQIKMSKKKYKKSLPEKFNDTFTNEVYIHSSRVFRQYSNQSVKGRKYGKMRSKVSSGRMSQKSDASSQKGDASSKNGEKSSHHGHAALERLVTSTGEEEDEISTSVVVEGLSKNGERSCCKGVEIDRIEIENVGIDEILAPFKDVGAVPFKTISIENLGDCRNLKGNLQGDCVGEFGSVSSERVNDTSGDKSVKGMNKGMIITNEIFEAADWQDPSTGGMRSNGCISLFGVYDGHGGSHVAKYVAMHMSSCLRNVLIRHSVEGFRKLAQEMDLNVSTMLQHPSYVRNVPIRSPRKTHTYPAVNPFGLLHFPVERTDQDGACCTVDTDNIYVEEMGNNGVKVGNNFGETTARLNDSPCQPRKGSQFDLVPQEPQAECMKRQATGGVNLPSVRSSSSSQSSIFETKIRPVPSPVYSKLAPNVVVHREYENLADNLRIPLFPSPRGTPHSERSSSVPKFPNHRVSNQYGCNVPFVGTPTPGRSESHSAKPKLPPFAEQIFKNEAPSELTKNLSLITPLERNLGATESIIQDKCKRFFNSRIDNTTPLSRQMSAFPKKPVQLCVDTYWPPLFERHAKTCNNLELAFSSPDNELPNQICGPPNLTQNPEDDTQVQAECVNCDSQITAEEHFPAVTRSNQTLSGKKSQNSSKKNQQIANPQKNIIGEIPSDKKLVTPKKKMKNKLPPFTMSAYFSEITCADTHQNILHLFMLKTYLGCMRSAHLKIDRALGKPLAEIQLREFLNVHHKVPKKITQKFQNKTKKYPEEEGASSPLKVGELFQKRGTGVEAMGKKFFSSFSDGISRLFSGPSKWIKGHRYKAPHLASQTGCTACTILITGTEIIVANVGDSRCVLCRAAEAIPLTRDHKPQLREEMIRIYCGGGYVDMGRVNGCLNLSRALGDRNYKTDAFLPQDRQIISPSPDVAVVTIDHLLDQFLLIGCDGLFEFLSCQEIVDFVRDRIETKALSDISSELFDCIMSPNPTLFEFGCDNMTAIIIDLKPWSRIKNIRLTY